MRRKDAEEIINSLPINSEVSSLGNGKIPNVKGVGMLTISRNTVFDKDGDEVEVWYYRISDTVWDKGVWRAQGGSRGGAISKQEAINLLTAYGRSKSKLSIYMP